VPSGSGRQDSLRGHKRAGHVDLTNVATLMGQQLEIALYGKNILGIYASQ